MVVISCYCCYCCYGCTLLWLFFLFCLFEPAVFLLRSLWRLHGKLRVSHFGLVTEVSFRSLSSYMASWVGWLVDASSFRSVRSISLSSSLLLHCVVASVVCRRPEVLIDGSLVEKSKTMMMTMIRGMTFVRFLMFLLFLVSSLSFLFLFVFVVCFCLMVMVEPDRTSLTSSVDEWMSCVFDPPRRSLGFQLVLVHRSVRRSFMLLHSFKRCGKVVGCWYS